VKRYSFPIALLAALAVATFVALDPSLGVPAATVKEVASTAGQNGLEFVAQLEQEGTSFTGYGYVTFVKGMKDSLLFSDPVIRTAATARFTFYATTERVSGGSLTDVFAVATKGTLQFYFDATPSADFSDPLSFADGTLIASGPLRFHNIVMVEEAMQTGFIDGAGDFTQGAAHSFNLAGKTFRLGHVGQLLRISVKGKGDLLDPLLPRALMHTGGNAVPVG
jgi:hypothetical protein